MVISDYINLQRLFGGSEDTVSKMLCFQFYEDELIQSYLTDALHLLNFSVISAYKLQANTLPEFLTTLFCTYSQFEFERSGLRHKYASLVRLECCRNRRTEEGRKKNRSSMYCMD